MNTEDVMLKLYEIQGQLSGLARLLDREKLVMAAEEVNREATEIGQRAVQLEGVLQEYQIDIDIAQRAKQSPHFIGLDMAEIGKTQTFTTKVKQ